ncbi:hypothetical protein [Paenarthrobacter nitroguajacolicus]|uniref:hypothetical protein n=1 Tax=Paenarthrobacter nitroguajacolicus TaxID=211146 RepID=UPI00248D1C72|nr:hypothetical protein [Paenarthrobacter nitroguajacolicus]MDI2033703.1 hypothetical protein [Paenarthrobacter nitroguajacolicus]
MNKNLLLGLGASAVLAMTLTACGGSTAASQEATSASPAASASSTPTPAKQYTNEELAALAGQIKASDGSSPAVLNGEELVGQYDSLVNGFGKATIEPESCKDLHVLGVPQTIAGSTSAGTARVKVGDFITSVALTSGVEASKLQEIVEDSKSEAETCGKITFSAEGDAVNASTEKIDGVGSVPGTIAFKTLMVFPDGKTGAIYTAYAVKDGVMISATASGTEGAAGGPDAAGALMDQAAALVK